jgi:hypothetical protein
LCAGPSPDLQRQADPELLSSTEDHNITAKMLGTQLDAGAARPQGHFDVAAGVSGSSRRLPSRNWKLAASGTHLFTR